jgi:hypothetical protein
MDNCYFCHRPVPRWPNYETVRLVFTEAGHMDQTGETCHPSIAVEEFSHRSCLEEASDWWLPADDPDRPARAAS